MSDYTCYLAHGKDYTIDTFESTTFDQTITFKDGTTMVLGDKTFDNLKQQYTYSTKN